MGLDLDLFEEEVPEDLVCGLCQKVLVHPVQNACSHLFCSSCLRSCVKTDAEVVCPTCNESLKKKTSSPSVPIKIQLLNLIIRCNHQCGKVCTLAELPDHIAEECPNAPVTCPHVHRGCKMTVKRAEVEEHIEECDYRMVHCEACGQRTAFIDLFTHQSRKRCLEKKLRQQVVKAIRTTNTEVRQHRKRLEQQHIRLELQQQRMVDHFRQTKSTANKVQQRPNNGIHNIDRVVGSNDCESSSPRGRETAMSAQLIHNSDIILMSSLSSHNAQQTVALNTPSPSRTGMATSTCRKCKRQFFESGNSPNSCRWHPGPIIDLFGGTCYSCGRLDYQKGCMMGYHEL